MTPDFFLEIKRKFFHSLSLLYALLYWVMGREVSLWALGIAFVLVGILEAVRLRNPAVNETMLRWFHGIHRESEIHKPSGILWTLLGCWLTMFFVPHRDIVVACLLYLAAGDAAASLVGKRWGHLRLGRKSLEGTLACFLACWAVGTIFLTPPFGSKEVVVGALIATAIEFMPIPLNDNLWMPFVPGIVLAYLRANIPL